MEAAKLKNPVYKTVVRYDIKKDLKGLSEKKRLKIAMFGYVERKK